MKKLNYIKTFNESIEPTQQEVENMYEDESFNQDSVALMQEVVEKLKPFHKKYGTWYTLDFLAMIIGGIEDLGDEYFEDPTPSK